MFRRLILVYLFSILTVSISAQSSFIKVIQKGGRYKFEIPDSILGKDILFGSRIVDLSEPSAKVYSAGQMRRPPVLVRFLKRGELIVIEEINNIADVNPDDPIFNPLHRNTKDGATTFFELEFYDTENGVNRIDVTKYFSEEVQIAWPLPENIKKGRIENRLSGIEFVKEFDDHINIRSYYEFTGGKETFTITVQYFLYLLPEKKLLTRYNDDRIGYQPFNLKSYSSGKPIRTKKFISRWRVEPSIIDIEKHKNGELVTPEKQIEFYIEPYFPKEWIPYIKLGVEDWNRAFEKIGFKDVLVAREFPTDNPDFDPFDIKTNVIRYIPLEEANAAGQIWTDPRSGEIINGEVLWWNNVINLINMWRFTQTAAVDPKARSLEYDIEITGEMIRYAIAHEIGHVLGLQHNMRGSFGYPADSLRSPTFTKLYGTTATIMDYARYNHIARPGDLERGVKLTPPLLGPFDYLSIEYGYRYFHNISAPESEIPHLDSVFRSKRDSSMYKFAPFITAAISPDPSAQPESLGDDIIKSSTNGILNTRIILDSLIVWTKSSESAQKDILERYDALSKQYFRYITLVISYIGGTYNEQQAENSSEPRYTSVLKSRQKQALEFVIKHLNEAPYYLDKESINIIIGSRTEDLLKKQSEVLISLTNNFIIPRILNNLSYNSSGYDLKEYLSDLDNLIWQYADSESVYDNNMRITYIQMLNNARQLKQSGENSTSGFGLLYTECIDNQANLTLKRLKRLIKKSLPNQTHYNFLYKLLNK